MAPVNPPAYLQASTYPARIDRLTNAAVMSPSYSVGPLAGRPGVKPSPAAAGFRVTQRGTPDQWVSVAAGTCYIQATSSTGGLYTAHNDASYDAQLAPSHASLPRKDLIIARVQDAIDDTGTDNGFVITSVEGTPASSPTRPLAPSQSLALAEVLVPAASTAVTNANITDLRHYSVAIGGVIPLYGFDDIPANPYPGMKVYRVDIKVEFVWDGTSWLPLPYGPWSTYTPSLTAVTTAPSLGTGSKREGAYMQTGKLVHLRVNFAMGTSGSTGGSGVYRVSLPVTARTLLTGNHYGAGEAYDSSANDVRNLVVRIGPGPGWSQLEMLVDSTLWGSGGPFALANTDTFGFSITYEAA